MYFTRLYQYHLVFCFASVFDHSWLRLTNRTDSCYEFQMIDIAPLYSSLLQFCNTTGSQSSSLHRYSSFDDRKFLDMTINVNHICNSKVSTQHTIFIRLDELINVASDFDIIFDLDVKFNQAIKIVLFDD
jgi:hypothetical protein